MKSAYELAMERLNKSAPTVKLNSDQKKALAELDSTYTAKIAELEITFQGDLDQAAAAGNGEVLDQLRQRLSGERRKLQAALEEKKEQVRQARA